MFGSMVLALTDRDDLSHWVDARLEPLVRQFLDMQVARATAPLLREIEELRTELAAWHRYAHSHAGPIDDE